jgi:hypothetical protein
VQILPIQWRASLQLAERGDEDVQHGLDNRFTMSGTSRRRHRKRDRAHCNISHLIDITLPKIPAIRQITNSVLLDVPLFMSQHRQSMIEAVCIQANKAYRMWCARNPGFDSKGRVHIIGHSVSATWRYIGRRVGADQLTRLVAARVRVSSPHPVQSADTDASHCGPAQGC